MPPLKVSHAARLRARRVDCLPSSPEMTNQENRPFNLLRWALRHSSQCLHIPVSDDCLPVAVFLS